MDTPKKYVGFKPEEIVGACHELSDQECVSMAQTCAAFNLRRAARLVTQLFDQTLKPTGLKVTQFSLLVSAHMSENLVLHKLARVMGLDRTTLSRNLRVLEKRGLVVLVPGEDKREVRVRLTEKGNQVLEEAIPLWAEAQAQVVDTVGGDKWLDMINDLRGLTRELR